MSLNIEYLIQLHRDGVITNNDLKKGIRALNLPDESSSKPTVVGNPNRKKMHIFGFVGIFEYIC